LEADVAIDHVELPSGVSVTEVRNPAPQHAVWVGYHGEYRDCKNFGVTPDHGRCIVTSDNVSKPETVEMVEGRPGKSVDDQLVDELVGRAQAEGLQLTGEGGLLQQLTKRLLESALEGEITDHLGYDKHDPAGKNGGQLP
jgi:hypothetical protein